MFKAPLTLSYSAFAHKRTITSGNDLTVGQMVSFVLEDGPKGASATKIQEELGMAPMVEEEEIEGERMFGKVKVKPDASSELRGKYLHLGSVMMRRKASASSCVVTAKARSSDTSAIFRVIRSP